MLLICNGFLLFNFGWDYFFLWLFWLLFDFFCLLCFLLLLFFLEFRLSLNLSFNLEFTFNFNLRLLLEFSLSFNLRLLLRSFPVNLVFKIRVLIAPVIYLFIIVPNLLLLVVISETHQGNFKERSCQSLQF